MENPLGTMNICLRAATRHLPEANFFLPQGAPYPDSLHLRRHIAVVSQTCPLYYVDTVALFCVVVVHSAKLHHKLQGIYINA